MFMITSNEAGSLRKRGYSSRPAMERSLVSSSSMVPERTMQQDHWYLRKPNYGRRCTALSTAAIMRRTEEFLRENTSLTAGVNRGMRGWTLSPIPTRAFGVRDVASWLYESFKEWNAICHMPFAPHHPWSTRTSLPLSMSNPMEES
jgi:hypothetical protein